MMRSVLRQLEEGYGRPLFDDDTDVGDLLAFAVAYASLGNKVQDQLHDLVDWGGKKNPPSVNANAVREIQVRMGRFHPQIAALCEAWFEAGDED